MKEIGTYQHYKGDVYDLLHIAEDCRTLAKLVVYQSQKDGRVWVRGYNEFFEILTINGVSTPRFKRII